MTRELTKEEIQGSYDKEQANIGKFSSLLSTSCKVAWTGSLAIFFSSIVAANAETLDKFRPVFYFLWAAAFLGAAAFVIEIMQYVFAYSHAREFTEWISRQKRMTLDELSAHSISSKSKTNNVLFVLKLVCSGISALFVAVGIFLVAFQKI